jgi:hypothetical protein
MKSHRKNGRRSPSRARVQQKVQRAARDRVVADPPSAPTRRAADRSATGQFVPAHFGAFRGGLHTDRVPPELEFLETERRRFLDQAYADDGVTLDDGISADERERRLLEIPRRRRGNLEARAMLHRRIHQLDHALDVYGLFARDGKLRERWLSQLASLITAALAIDRLLGLHRVARDTAPTIADWIRDHAHTPQAHSTTDDGDDDDTNKTDDDTGGPDDHEAR